MQRQVYLNPDAASWCTSTATPPDTTYHFHQSLPGYSPTPLLSLEEVAAELGVRKVYLKHESSRLGLPAYKILGASWGTFRAIVVRLGLALDTADIATVIEALASNRFMLYAATDGNHGRAVARMGAMLGVPVEIHTPAGLRIATLDAIRSEGATVVESTGNYDIAVAEAHDAAARTGGLLIQDNAFEGYEEIPKWIVEGYSTMLREIDEQLGGAEINLFVVPIGVGSFAQAVVTHYKRKARTTKILTVEPETAACLWTSLTNDAPVVIDTSYTIMAGMNCGTVSSIAWPVLRAGIDASLTVSDYEDHQACVYLNSCGISAGSCGAAPLAALRRLSAADKNALGLDETSVIVMPCTEAFSQYDPPLEGGPVAVK